MSLSHHFLIQICSRIRSRYAGKSTIIISTDDIQIKCFNFFFLKCFFVLFRTLSVGVSMQLKRSFSGDNWHAYRHNSKIVVVPDCALVEWTLAISLLLWRCSASLLLFNLCVWVLWKVAGWLGNFIVRYLLFMRGREWIVCVWVHLEIFHWGRNRA